MPILNGLILVALASLGGVGAVPPAVADYARFVLGVRRIFPELLSTAAEHNVNLPHLAARAPDLIAELGPAAPRALETIRVDRVTPSTVTEDFVEPNSLLARRAIFANVARRFGPRFDRARMLVHLRGVLENPAAPLDDDLIDVVRFAVWSLGVDDVADQLAEFTINDLRAFGTRREYKARFARLRADLGLSEDALGRLAEVRRRARYGLVEYGHRERQLHTETLILKELAPELALIKGYLAHDCSSRECFGYPLAPTERVFALCRRDGAVRGLAAVSRVTVGGRPSLYVNTLSGLNMNGDLTRMALAGLRQLLAPGESLSLPTTECLAENCNFSIVRAALHALIADRAARPLVYADAREREIIERYSLRPYDRMDAHASAHAIHLPALEDPDLRFTRRMGSDLAWAPAPPEPGEDVEALVEIISSLRFEMAREFWDRLGRPEAEVADLIDLLTNVAGRTRADFVTEVINRLTRLGVEVAHARQKATLPSVLRLGHLVASDGLEPGVRAGTFASVVRMSTAERRILRTQAFRAWIDRLDPDAREQMVLATLNSLEAYRRDRKREFVTAELIPRLIPAAEFARRAPEFNARGIHWTTLAQAAETFDATIGDTRERDAEVTSTRFMTGALRTAASRPEFARIFNELLATNAHTARVVTALGQSLGHVRALGFDDAALANLATGFGGGVVLRDVVRWTTRPIERAAEFIAMAQTLAAGATESRRTLVRAALFARADDFLRARPTPIEIARFRVLATARNGPTDRMFLDAVLAEYPRTWPELPVLARADAPDEDTALLHAGRAHLERLTALKESWPNPTRLIRRAVGSLADEVDQNIRLRRATDADAFIAQLRAYPKRPLTPPQVRRFVGLGGTVAQFRELIALTNEIRGYGRAAAPIVRTLDDLREITRPIEIPGLDHYAVRAEIRELMDEVARAPGAAARFTEVDLDRVASDVGLDIRRNEIAPLSGATVACEVALSPSAKP